MDSPNTDISQLRQAKMLIRSRDIERTALEGKFRNLTSSITYLIHDLLSPDNENGLPQRFRRAHDDLETYGLESDVAGHISALNHNSQQFLDHALLSAQAALQNIKEARTKFDASPDNTLPDLKLVEGRMKQVALDLAEIKKDIEAAGPISRLEEDNTEFGDATKAAIASAREAINTFYGAESAVGGMRYKIIELIDGKITRAL